MYSLEGGCVNGTLRTILISVLVLGWAGIHVGGIVEHYSVPATVDTGFTTLVGAILVSPQKPDKSKD